MMSVGDMKRVGLGLAAAIGALFVVSALGSLWAPFSFRSMPAMSGNAAAMFVAALAGTWAAGRSFVMPSIVLATALWVLLVYILYSIAAVAGQGAILDIAIRNAGALPACLAGGLAGALLGQLLFRGDGPRA